MIKQLPHESYSMAKEILLRKYVNTNYTLKALHHRLQVLPTCSKG